MWKNLILPGTLISIVSISMLSACQSTLGQLSHSTSSNINRCNEIVSRMHQSTQAPYQDVGQPVKPTAITNAKLYREYEHYDCDEALVKKQYPSN